MDSVDNRDPEPERPDAEANPSGEPPREESLFEVIAATVVLVQKTWADRWALAKAESRLAIKSAVFIALLISCLALVAILIWVIILGGLAYYILTLGFSWVGVVVGLLLAQGLLAMLIVWQIRRLSRSLSLPATRQAFARLKETSQSTGETPHAGAQAAGES